MSYPHFPRATGNTFTPNITMNVPVGQPTSQPLNVIPTGTSVLAHYHEYAWYFGIVQNYNLTRNGTLVYQVLFRSGEIRSVASAQVLSQQSNNQNIEVGSRVVVQHPTKSMFISSLVGELPCVDNMFRYLLFLDDGSACYKSKDKLWVINLVENPILMLPTAYKSFIQRYFMMSGQSVKCLNMNINDLILFTNFDNMTLQFTGKVIQVDCSIVLIQYSQTNGSLVEEWMHRGSNRILSLSQNPAIFHNARVNGAKNNAQSSHLPVNMQSDALPIPNTASTQSEPVSSKRYIKSPLKSKQYMVPPTYDPFMFSDDEDSKTKSTKFNQFNSWSVENSSSDNQPPSTSPQPTIPTIRRSPIIVLDDTPEKKETVLEPPPYPTLPKPDLAAMDLPRNNSNDSFLSPTSVTEVDSPHLQKQSSVFSWSAPVESDTRRCLKLSPKASNDDDFDFADTILNTPSSATPTANNQEDNKLALKPKDEIIVLDDDDPILKHHHDTLYSDPIEILIDNSVVPVCDTKPEINIEVTNTPTATNLPMIIHQEACDVTDDVSINVDTTQNGNTIEVVVGCNNGETVISVAPTIEIVTDQKSESQLRKVSSPESLKLPTSKSRKRRYISPLKSPVSAIPKLKINLRNITDSNLNTSKDLAAQKCVKRARKQQSKESSKNHTLGKKKKIVKATVKCEPLLFMKKEPIKINSDAKIARWVSPWSRLRKKVYVQHVDSPLFSQVLQKVQAFQQDEELEEGEIDESDGEVDEDSAIPEASNNCSAFEEHECSLLCNKFNSESTQVDSPLLLPLQYSWRRRTAGNSIEYISPCGKILTDLDLVQSHLVKTKYTLLNKNNFCFNPDISLQMSTPKLDFDPIFTDNDLSNGMESVPISFVSNIGPIIKYNFHYIIDSLVDFKIIEDSNKLHSCECEDRCLLDCSCVSKDSKIKTECNNTCRCSINCNNRQSQHGLQHKLQIVQKDTKFHVITLHDIPAHTFICSLAGVVKRSCPEITDFVFPLSSEIFNEVQQIDNAVKSEKITVTKSTCLKNTYHDESCFIVSSDLELVQRSHEAKLNKFQMFNQYWAKTAIKHDCTESLPNMSQIYPSINGRRDTMTRSKKYSGSHDDVSKKCSVELYLDCTEFGNIGRFIRVAPNHNIIIQPVYVDSTCMPWLVLYSSCKISSLSELIMKPW